MAIWERNGHIIEDASGNPIECDVCPCGEDSGYKGPGWYVFHTGTNARQGEGNFHYCSNYTPSYIPAEEQDAMDAWFQAMAHQYPVRFYGFRFYMSDEAAYNDRVSSYLPESGFDALVYSGRGTYWLEEEASPVLGCAEGMTELVSFWGQQSSDRYFFFVSGPYEAQPTTYSSILSPVISQDESIWDYLHGWGWPVTRIGNRPASISAEDSEGDV